MDDYNLKWVYYNLDDKRIKRDVYQVNDSWIFKIQTCNKFETLIEPVFFST